MVPRLINLMSDLHIVLFTYFTTGMNEESLADKYAARRNIFPSLMEYFH